MSKKCVYNRNLKQVSERLGNQRNEKITINLDVKTSENDNLKTIWFSSYRKLEKVRCCANYRKEKKENKNNNTYNMAEGDILARNKEIFRHGLFVGIRFPYIFLDCTP